MSSTIWIMIAILALILIFGILAIIAVKSQKKPRPTDYYTFFIMGIIWLGFGIIMQFTQGTTGSFFFIMGLVFIAIGLSHKKDWKKNHKANQWKNLSKTERAIRFWITIILGIVLLVGIIAFYLLQKGIF